MLNLYHTILNKEIDAIQDLLPPLSSRLSWNGEEIKLEQQRALADLLAYAKVKKARRSFYYAMRTMNACLCQRAGRTPT